MLSASLLSSSHSLTLSLSVSELHCIGPLVCWSIGRLVGELVSSVLCLCVLSMHPILFVLFVGLVLLSSLFLLCLSCLSVTTSISQWACGLCHLLAVSPCPRLTESFCPYLHKFCDLPFSVSLYVLQCVLYCLAHVGANRGNDLGLQGSAIAERSC